MQQQLTTIWLSTFMLTAALASCERTNPIEENDIVTDSASANIPTGDVIADDNTGRQADSAENNVQNDTLGDVHDDSSANDNTEWSGGTDGTVVAKEVGKLITDNDGNQFVCFETQCDGRVLECGDCIDNDGDGNTDWRDRECLGPCDNTEGPALISGVGGVTGSTCHVDCYFDYGNGMGTGSDDCWWSHECDPLAPEAPTCEYRASRVNNQKFCPTEQSERCTNVCLPFTPNGCDCFGCCTFPELSGAAENNEDAYVWIGAKDNRNAGMCTFADILDESKCPRCTPVANCLNTCGHCEICIGKPELPDDCYPENSDSDNDDTDRTPPSEQCPEDITPCSYSDTLPCEEGYYCISGCCHPTIIVE